MNKKSTWIVIGVILIIIAFVGGLEYGKSTAASSSSAASRGATFGSSTGTRSFAGRAGGTGGGLVAGTIVAVDPTSISIQLPNSTSTTATTGSTVVLYSDGTSILKSVVGSPADLSVGESVTIQGTANSDGSMSANEIQIRPTPTGQ